MKQPTTAYTYQPNTTENINPGPRIIHVTNRPEILKSSLPQTQPQANTQLNPEVMNSNLENVNLGFSPPRPRAHHYSGPGPIRPNANINTNLNTYHPHPSGPNAHNYNHDSSNIATARSTPYNDEPTTQEPDTDEILRMLKRQRVESKKQELKLEQVRKHVTELAINQIAQNSTINNNKSGNVASKPAIPVVTERRSSLQSGVQNAKQNQNVVAPELPPRPAPQTQPAQLPQQHVYQTVPTVQPVQQIIRPQPVYHMHPQDIFQPIILDEPIDPYSASRRKIEKNREKEKSRLKVRSSSYHGRGSRKTKHRKEIDIDVDQYTSCYESDTSLLSDSTSIYSDSELAYNEKTRGRNAKRKSQRKKDRKERGEDRKTKKDKKQREDRKRYDSKTAKTQSRQKHHSSTDYDYKKKVIDDSSPDRRDRDMRGKRHSPRRHKSRYSSNSASPRRRRRSDGEYHRGYDSDKDRSRERPRYRSGRYDRSPNERRRIAFESGHTSDVTVSHRNWHQDIGRHVIYPSNRISQIPTQLNTTATMGPLPSHFMQPGQAMPQALPHHYNPQVSQVGFPMQSVVGTQGMPAHNAAAVAPRPMPRTKLVKDRRTGKTKIILANQTTPIIVRPKHKKSQYRRKQHGPTNYEVVSSNARTGTSGGAYPAPRTYLKSEYIYK